MGALHYAYNNIHKMQVADQAELDALQDNMACQIARTIACQSVKALYVAFVKKTTMPEQDYLQGVLCSPYMKAVKVYAHVAINLKHHFESLADIVSVNLAGKLAETLLTKTNVNIMAMRWHSVSTRPRQHLEQGIRQAVSCQRAGSASVVCTDSRGCQAAGVSPEGAAVEAETAGTAELKSTKAGTHKAKDAKICLLKEQLAERDCKTSHPGSSPTGAVPGSPRERDSKHSGSSDHCLCREWKESKYCPDCKDTHWVLCLKDRVKVTTDK
eukprot:944231-Rhodomonas_salina.2